MLNQFKPNQYRTYAYRFSEDFPTQAAQLYAVGRDKVTSVDYAWDGRNRADHGNWLLQYTISGSGVFVADNQSYNVTAGRGFFVQIPSEHHYYLPDNSGHWEFIYILLYGELVPSTWKLVTDQLGVVPEIHAESTLIRLIHSIHQQASDKQIKDSYQAAALAFQVLMELHRAVKFESARHNGLPDPIARAVSYLELHYANIKGLDELAYVAGVSKFHFARMFHKATGMTPLDYTTKVRLEKSMQLLRGSELSIQAIAQRIGYANGNYFTRLFRARMGMSPAEFRSDRSEPPIDHYTIY